MEDEEGQAQGEEIGGGQLLLASVLNRRLCYKLGRQSSQRHLELRSDGVSGRTDNLNVV